MLIDNIGDFSMYASKNADYKTLSKRIFTLSLLQKLTIIGPLIGTILNYAEGNSCNQKVFCNDCNRAMGLSLWLKRKKGK